VLVTAGLARVTISAPQRRVDVALPEHVPLVELLPELLSHSGEGLADDGERHGGWLLRRADGAVLTPAQGLFPQGVRDGEVLHLVPARAEWPELEYDDVVEAIADGARRRGAAWSPGATRTATLYGAAVLLTAGIVAVLRGGTAWTFGAYVALGIAVLLTLAAVTASRAYGNAVAGGALGGFALPYAGLGGALLVADDLGRAAAGGGAPVVGPVAWLGAPQLLVGSVAVLLVSVLGAAGVAAGLRVFAAGVTVGLLGALAGLAGFVFSTEGAAAVLMAALVCGIGVLPLLAIRFGKLPVPPITLPTGEESEGFTAGRPTALDAARERPDRSRVFAAVARTEELLSGMLTGHAILFVCSAIVLVPIGGTSARVLVAVAAVALLLRSRLFITVRQRVPVLVAGLGGLSVLAVALVFEAGEAGLLGLVAAAVLVALVVTVAGATYANRPPSPYMGRLADVVDVLTVVSVVPVACAVLDLYSRVRGLSG
jgi:type VII secretion integral membrane protein EccD